MNTDDIYDPQEPSCFLEDMEDLLSTLVEDARMQGSAQELVNQGLGGQTWVDESYRARQVVKESRQAVVERVMRRIREGV